MKRLIPLLFCSLLSANLSTLVYGDYLPAALPSAGLLGNTPLARGLGKAGQATRSLAEPSAIFSDRSEPARRNPDPLMLARDYGDRGDTPNPMNMMDRAMFNPFGRSNSMRRYGRHRYPPGYGIPPYGPAPPFGMWPGAPVAGFPPPRAAIPATAPKAAAATVPNVTTAPSLPPVLTDQTTQEVTTQRFRPLTPTTAPATAPEAISAATSPTPGSFRPLESKTPDSATPQPEPQPALVTDTTPGTPAMAKAVANQPPQQLPATRLPEATDWTLPDGSKPVFRPLSKGE